MNQEPLIIEGDAVAFDVPIMGRTLRLLNVDGESVEEAIRNHFSIYAHDPGWYRLKIVVEDAKK